MDNVKNENYILIQGWMLNELELKGNELMVYAIIYGFSQKEGHYFNGSIQYLADWTNSTRQGIMKVLNSLLEKGHLIKIASEETGKPNKYFAVKGSKQSLLATKFTSEQSLPDQSTEFTRGSQQSLHNNITNNINNITTTDEDIKKQEDEEENSSSSLEILEKEKIRQIKSALQTHGISVATCKNIMDLVYSKHIDLERIKAVLTVAPLKNWEDGAIYKALKENWSVEIKSYNIEKPKTILEEKARKVINQTLEAKEKRDRTVEKLKQIFETLSEHKKKYLEEKAERMAKEKYPDNIYKIMARTESIYKVIEEYLEEKEVEDD